MATITGGASKSYPIQQPIRLTGSGATPPEWTLDSNATLIDGSLFSETITIVIKAVGATRIQFGEQGQPKTSFAVLDLEGISGTQPNCSSSDDSNGECTEECPVCPESSLDERPAQQTCENSSLYKSPNSISVDRNYQVTLYGSGLTLRTMGGELSMRFARVNGTDAPLPGGIPMGTGGGQGARIGMYRQVYFDPDPANPRFAIVNGFDGSQNAFYYSYDDGADKVWLPGPAECNELRLKPSGQWRELSCERTYFDYDAKGRYYRKTKLNGSEVYFSYDLNDRVQRLSGDFPGEVYFTYDADGNLARVTQRDPSGPDARTWEYEYQNVGSFGKTLSKLTGPMGCTAYFGYNTRGEVLTEVDALNYASLYEYTYFSNTGFRLAKSTPPNVAPTQFAQNALTFSMTKHVQEPELTSYYTRDGEINRIIQAQFGLPPFPSFPSFPSFPAFPQSYFYGSYGKNNNSTIDQLGRTSYFDYDNFHNTTRTQDPLGNTAYFEYAPNNQRSREVRPRWPEANFQSFTTYYEYDPQGNRIKSIDALGNATTMAYDRGGVPVKQRDARGNATYFGYDAYGRQTRMQDALGNSAYFGYDLYGNRTRALSPRWPEAGFAAFTTYYEYDLLDRPVRTVDAEGDVTEADYSARCGEGPLAQYQLVGGAWRATYYNYDGIRRQVRMIDPLNQATTQAYSGDTNLVLKQSDKRGFGTYYAYDGFKRLRITSDALNNATYYNYDAMDNRTHVVTPRWRETGLYGSFTSYFGYDGANRMVTAQDPLGNSTYFGYDAAGNRTRAVGARWKESNFAAFTTYYQYDRLDRQAALLDALGNVSRSGYDEVGNLVRSQDARGNTVYFQYDALNRQDVVIDPLGNIARTGFDAASNAARSQDARGNTTYFAYDRVNRQTQVLDALDQRVYFAYDEAGNRTLQFDHLTATSFALTYFGYDKLDRLVKAVDALSRTAYFEYDPNGNQTRAILPGDPPQVTLNFYDELNRIKETTSPFGSATYFSYDAESNLARLVGPRWRETNRFADFATYFGYDALNRRVRVLDPLQNSAYFGYDAGGNLTRGVDKRWKESTQAAFTTYYEYDRLDRPSRTIDTQGSAFNRFYDQVGNLTALKPPQYGAAYFAYEARNLLATAVDGAFNTTYFNYDQVGNRSRVVSPRGFNTYFGYDALNRLGRVLDAENGSAYFGYDIGGNTDRVVDALARVTYFSYDKLDRLTGSLAANNTQVSFFYDLAGNRNVETDQRGFSTYYFYDTGNRLALERDPLGVSAYYGYDDGSNLARTLDRKGVAVYFGYDALDRRTAIQYPAENQYFTYDAAGNLTRTLDAWGASTFAYDTLNRLARRATPRTDAVYYGYDLTSNLQRLQYPRGLAAAYFGYDQAQRLEKLRAPSLNGCYYAYDAASNVARRLLGNQTATYYVYDKAERVTSIRHVTSAGTPIVYFDYNRDVAGRILRIAREGDLAVYYSYDSIDRLTAEVWRKKSDNAQVYGFFYDYDGANNRLKLRREFGTGTEWDSAYFAYAADNSLTQRRKQTPPSTFLSTYYSYDANGALIKEWTPGGGGGWGNQAWGSSPYGGGTGDDVVYYEYGPQQLVTRIIPTSEAPTQFFYDGRLNRYLINQAGTPTYYLWDGLNQLEERNADGALKARYTHGNYRQYGIGSVVEVERVANSTTYFQYLHMDHRGTAYAVTDASQNTQLSYVQDAFGTQLAATGGANPNVPNNLIYQSNWLTLQIGDRNYGVSRYRLYDPDLGIFLQRDFLPFINKYRTFSNNPPNQVDHNGLINAASHGTGQRYGVDTTDPPGAASVADNSAKKTLYLLQPRPGEFKKGPTGIPIGGQNPGDPSIIDLDPRYGGGSINRYELNEFLKEHAHALPDLRDDTPYEQSVRLKGILTLAKAKYKAQQDPCERKQKLKRRIADEIEALDRKFWTEVPKWNQLYYSQTVGEMVTALRRQIALKELELKAVDSQPCDLPEDMYCSLISQCICAATDIGALLKYTPVPGGQGIAFVSSIISLANDVAIIKICGGLDAWVNFAISQGIPLSGTVSHSISQREVDELAAELIKTSIGTAKCLSD